MHFINLSFILSSPYNYCFWDSLDNLKLYFTHNCFEYAPSGSEVKASACNAGDLGSIPGSRRSPREGNGNTLQYSCLENPLDGGAWWATVHRVTKSWIQLSDFTFFLSFFNYLLWLYMILHFCLFSFSTHCVCGWFPVFTVCFPLPVRYLLPLFSYF